MNLLTLETLRQFVKLAGERLEGEWVLLGGTLLWVLGIGNRPTTDINLVAVSEKEAARSIDLLKLADHLSLPLETINQAAVVYLWRIKDFRSHLVLLHGGAKGKIYRPDGYLFLKLKLPRFNEADLDDCKCFLGSGLAQAGESYKSRDLIGLVKKEIAATESHSPKARRLVEFHTFMNAQPG